MTVTADFLKPEITDLYADVLEYIRANINEVATMDFMNIISPPNKAIRYNVTNYCFEQYSSSNSSWSVIGPFPRNNTWTGSNTFSSITLGNTDLATWLNGKQDTISVSSPLSLSGNSISISEANSTTNGYLSSADWNNFNGKQNAITSSNKLAATNISGLAAVATGGKINDLTDVTITSAATNNYLRYDGSKWVNTTFPTIPTKTSQLTNDSGFITGSYLPLSGGTMTGNILPNNSSRTIGSTSNYFGNVYTAYVNFLGQGQTNQDIAATNTTTVRLRSNGKNYNFGAGAGGNVAGSDIRMKKNIISMPNGVLDILNQLRPVKFDFKIDESNKSFYAGFIAQEVDPILPNLAIAPITPETDDMYGIDYAGFVPYLVKAIQELSAKVSELENKLATLGL